MGMRAVLMVLALAGAKVTVAALVPWECPIKLLLSWGNFEARNDAKGGRLIPEAAGDGPLAGIRINHIHGIAVRNVDFIDQIAVMTEHLENGRPTGQYFLRIMTLEFSRTYGMQYTTNQTIWLKSKDCALVTFDPNAVYLRCGSHKPYFEWDKQSNLTVWTPPKN